MGFKRPTDSSNSKRCVRQSQRSKIQCGVFQPSAPFICGPVVGSPLESRAPARPVLAAGFEAGCCVTVTVSESICHLPNARLQLHPPEETGPPHSLRILSSVSASQQHSSLVSLSSLLWQCHQWLAASPARVPRIDCPSDQPPVLSPPELSNRRDHRRIHLNTTVTER